MRDILIMGITCPIIAFRNLVQEHTSDDRKVTASVGIFCKHYIASSD